MKSRKSRPDVGGAAVRAAHVRSAGVVSADETRLAVVFGPQWSSWGRQCMECDRELGFMIDEPGSAPGAAPVDRSDQCP